VRQVLRLVVMMFRAVLAALAVLPCAAYFEVDTSLDADKGMCPFAYPDYEVEEQDMSTEDADKLFSCNAPLSAEEAKVVSAAVQSGMPSTAATSEVCFLRGCWYAEHVTMSATVSIPKGELMHNGFPHRSTFELLGLTGTNVTGLCFPPAFASGGGYLCVVDRPDKSSARRELAANAGASQWVLHAGYSPSPNTVFLQPLVAESNLKVYMLTAGGVLLVLVAVGLLVGGKGHPGVPQI